MTEEANVAQPEPRADARSPLVRPLDRARLRDEFEAGTPFPHVLIDGFLDDAFALEVADAYPTFDEAARIGHHFQALNEKGKVQITDSSLFPEPVRRLNEALAAPEFLADLEAITGIPNLVADPELSGGGMHVTGPRGRLDVHVDFNYLEDRQLYRRLNLLLYLNRNWEPDWGGAIELWDETVSTKVRAFEPKLNRCVLFETSEHSFHGVEPVSCPPGVTRASFAAYYYTRQPPAGYAGRAHSTIFKARPNERLRKYVLMPALRVKDLASDLRRMARAARDKARTRFER